MVTRQGAKDAHDHKKGWLGGNELAFSLLCGACLLSGFLLQQLGPFPDSVSRGFYIAAYVFGGFFALREAAEKVADGKFEIDFLMLVAAAGAAILGAWAEGALLLFLFSLGHALEHYAMGRATRAIDEVEQADQGRDRKDLMLGARGGDIKLGKDACWTRGAARAPELQTLSARISLEEFMARGARDLKYSGAV